MTLMEQASLAVASDVLQLPVEPTVAADGTYGIDITAILEIVMTVIKTLMENCPQSNANAARSLKKPNLLQRVALMSACKNHCDSCAVHFQKGLAGDMQRSMLKRAAAMSDEQALQLVQEARGFDYLLV